MMTLGDVFAAGWTKEAFERLLAERYGDVVAANYSRSATEAWCRYSRIMADLFGGEPHEYCDAAIATWQRNHGAAAGAASNHRGVLVNAAE